MIALNPSSVFWAGRARKQEFDNIDAFRRLMKEFAHLRFYQPNPVLAPWHVQTKIERIGFAPRFVNFWPHKAKAHTDGCETQTGYQGMKNVLTFALMQEGDE